MATYTVLGSDPPAPYPKYLNTMLMEAVQAKWDTYCPDHPVMNVDNTNNGIVFWDTEPRGTNETYIWFDLITDMRPPEARPIGWGREPGLAAVMIHIYCKGDTVEKIPDRMPVITNALQTLIKLEGKLLIPHSHYVTMIRVMDNIPSLAESHQTFKTNCQVNISYTMVYNP